VAIQVHRLIRDKKATAAVEFAFLALPFIVLIVGALQLFILLLTQQLIETAAEQIGRKILTGYVQKQAMTQSQFVTMACGLLPSTLNCNKLVIDVSVASSFSTAVTARPSVASIGNPTATTVLNYQPGTAGQIVVLRLMYALPVVSLPGFNLQMTSYGLNFPLATSVFKNEAYS
jgi:Flp pilus assembly protein TadG